MPSSKKVRLKNNPNEKHRLFLPLLGIIAVIWMLYRSIFAFPIWFDESIGKAVFFGLPVWFYVLTVNTPAILETMQRSKLWSGLFVGLGVGGVLGFVVALARVFSSTTVYLAPVFLAPSFWQEFLLALLTSFWETLFFFSFVMTVVLQRWPNWQLWKKIGLVVLIFVFFHLPNVFLRYSFADSLVYLALFGLFAVGQAFLFVTRKNAYALVLTQALWGMALLVHR